jgi:hypothetical protein
VDRDAVEMEFTYLMNAAVVRFGVDYSEQDKVLMLAEQVKGAINIALERLVGEASIKEVYEKLGLGKLYRLGLTELMALRRKSLKVAVEKIEKLSHDDKVLFSLVACIRESFPAIPACLNDDGSRVEHEDGSLPSGSRPLETVVAVETVSRLIDSLLAPTA